MKHRIPYNRPVTVGTELDYIRESIESGRISGDGLFTRRCHDLLEGELGAAAALLTHSCTGALEMAAILCGLGPGDEVIMPSFTFVSTANAVAMRGAVPVFVDVDPDTFNLDPARVEEAIGDRTRAMVAVHYAGVGCDMDALTTICERNALLLIEDAAQAHRATWGGRPLGTFGALGALSFHETKVVMAGEGGALIVNDPSLVEQAEIIREKGTDRSRFRRGEVDRYTWVDLGSSYLPADIVAAFLFAQLEQAERIVTERRSDWERYHAGFADLESAGHVRRPVIPAMAGHNAHIYHLLCGDRAERDALIGYLAERDIVAPFHYVPLHSAPAGRRLGRPAGPMSVTDDVSGRLIRLPLFPGIGTDLDRVVEELHAFYRS